MIYIFKTSVKTKKKVRKLKPHLNELLKQTKWNFDLEDCDKILRIDNSIDVSKEVINLLKKQGFNCEELPD